MLHQPGKELSLIHCSQARRLAGPKAGLSPSRTSCISRAYHAGYVTHLTGYICRRVWFATQRLHAFDMLMSFLTLFGIRGCYPAMIRETGAKNVQHEQWSSDELQ